jgi:hypothetical protein
MLPLVLLSVTVAPLFSASFWEGLIAIAFVTAIVIVCCAIPLLTGMQRGYVGLGIVGALVTLPFAIGLFPGMGCVTGLLSAIVCSAVIQLIPKFERPLLSQAEIEAETRKMRGY